MARISAYTALPSADGGDTLPILDVSATTTKKITKTAFLSDIIDGSLLATQAVKANKADFSVADQTARDVFTPFDGLMVYRKDLDAFQFYTGSRWRWVNPKNFGQTYPGANFLLTTSYTDRITAASVTTLGGEVELEVCIAFYNAASGADRIIDVNVVCDGSTIKNISGISSILNVSTAGSDYVTVKVRHTPSAGAHIYKIQAKASAGSAVYMTTDSYITIAEIG